MKSGGSVRSRIEPFRTRTQAEHAVIQAAAREARELRITLFGEQEARMCSDYSASIGNWNALECAGTHGKDELCKVCCDHQDVDDGHCLDCGDDRTEDMAAAAYDSAKASAFGGDK